MAQKLDQWVLHQRVALVGIVILTLAACNFVNKKSPVTRGANTSEAVVNIYLRALEKRDKPSILPLIPEHLIGEQAVQAKIEELGGHNLREVQVDYLIVKPHIKSVTIQGQYMSENVKDVKFKDQLYVSYFEPKWYLTIGQPKQPTTVPTARKSTGNKV